MSRARMAALTVAMVFAVAVVLGARVALTAPDTALPWSVLGSGGGSSSSTNYELGSTAGQSAIGGSQSTNYAMAAGYWGRALDTDLDGDPNVSDVCTNDANNDGDSDGICVGSGFQPPMTGDNDNCPSTPNSGQENADGDAWGDACETPECVGVATTWVTPPGDGDCDAFTTADENTIGTDSADACPDNTSDDAWPPDINNDMTVNVIDIGEYAGFFPSPPKPYRARIDLNADLAVNVIDIGVFGSGFFTKSCT